MRGLVQSEFIINYQNLEILTIGIHGFRLLCMLIIASQLALYNYVAIILVLSDSKNFTITIVAVKLSR